MHAIGVDIGGTKIAAGVVDAEGRILAQTRRATEPDDPTSIDRAVADVYAELSRDHEVRAIGVAAAGFVDTGRSTVLFAPNIAWRDPPHPRHPRQSWYRRCRRRRWARRRYRRPPAGTVPWR